MFDVEWSQQRNIEQNKKCAAINIIYEDGGWKNEGATLFTEQ